jgi:hypothetical protein
VPRTHRLYLGTLCWSSRRLIALHYIYSHIQPGMQGPYVPTCCHIVRPKNVYYQARPPSPPVPVHHAYESFLTPQKRPLRSVGAPSRAPSRMGCPLPCSIDPCADPGHLPAASTSTVPPRRRPHCCCVLHSYWRAREPATLRMHTNTVLRSSLYPVLSCPIHAALHIDRSLCT